MIIMLAIQLIVILPFRHDKIVKDNQYKIEYFEDYFSLNNMSSLFSILLAFNLQVYSIDLKNELENPTLKRLTTVNRVSNLFVLLMNLLMSVVAYLSLGKLKLTDIVYKYALSQGTSGWQRYMMRLTLIICLVLILLSMPMFNPSIR